MKTLGRILKPAALLLIFLGLLAGFQSTSHASLALSLSDGINAVTISDGGAGDSNPAAGAVTFIGAVGTNWTINITTALTYPALGTAALPKMDVSSFNLSGTGGTLTIMASEIGYTGGLAGFNLHVGGTTDGTVKFGLFLHPGNVLFGLGTPVATLGPFSGPSFSGDTSGNGAGATPFSLTLKAAITHGAAGGDTSFDLKTTPVPIPSALLLLGSGLAGIGIAARKRFRRDRG